MDGGDDADAEAELIVGSVLASGSDSGERGGRGASEVDEVNVVVGFETTLWVEGRGRGGGGGEVGEG